jgi:hypothetical protein
MQTATYNFDKDLNLKKLRIRNVCKMDRFCSKLESFLLSVTFTGLDKHSSLLREHIKNPKCFKPLDEGVRRRMAENNLSDRHLID